MNGSTSYPLGEYEGNADLGGHTAIDGVGFNTKQKQPDFSSVCTGSFLLLGINVSDSNSHRCSFGCGHKQVASYLTLINRMCSADLPSDSSADAHSRPPRNELLIDL